MKLQSLKTPGLVLDVAKVKRNAERMSQRVRQFGADLRPHIKTHKCIEVARIQTAGHSGAVTVSTLAEARAFATNGFSKITYAVPIEPGKIAEAIEISRDCELSLITDDLEVPDQLNDAAKQANAHLDLFLKVDCGYHRCGVEPATRKLPRFPGEYQTHQTCGLPESLPTPVTVITVRQNRNCWPSQNMNAMLWLTLERRCGRKSARSQS
jgi:D-serine deaminase-like pyridoxal phosphate-dependent protein